jgi:hypothetical protein
MIINMLGFLSILYACYVSWVALEFSAPFWFLEAAIFAGCGIGLVLRYKWAKWLWYGCSASISIWWLSTVVFLALKGWPDEDVSDTIISLIPGALLLFVCIGGSVAVSRQYAMSSV